MNERMDGRTDRQTKTIAVMFLENMATSLPLHSFQLPDIFIYI